MVKYLTKMSREKPRKSSNRIGDVPSEYRTVYLPDIKEKIYSRIKLLCERAVVNKVMNKMARCILITITDVDSEGKTCMYSVYYVCTMYVCMYVCMYVNCYTLLSLANNTLCTIIRKPSNCSTSLQTATLMLSVTTCRLFKGLFL